MKYKIIEDLKELKIINSLKELGNVCFIESENEYFDNTIYDEAFFDNNCLIQIPYEGSSSVLSYKLLYFLINETDVINIEIKYNPLPMFMDLRRFTFYVPYHKTNKSINLV